MGGGQLSKASMIPISAMGKEKKRRKKSQCLTWTEHSWCSTTSAPSNTGGGTDATHSDCWVRFYTSRWQGQSYPWHIPAGQRRTRTKHHWDKAEIRQERI